MPCPASLLQTGGFTLFLECYLTSLPFTWVGHTFHMVPHYHGTSHGVPP